MSEFPVKRRFFLVTKVQQAYGSVAGAIQKAPHLVSMLM